MTINKSMAKFSGYAEKKYTKIVQADCGDAAINKIKRKLDSLGTIVVLIGTEKRHKIDLENLFEVELQHSCKPKYKFLFSDDQEPSYLYLNETTSEIVVTESMENSDFLGQPTDRPNFTYEFRLRGYMEDNEAELRDDITFQLDHTLDCHKNHPVTLEDHPVFLDKEQSATLKEYQLRSHEIIVSFDKLAVADKTKNENCDIKNDGYILVQHNYNDTSLNPG